VATPSTPSSPTTTATTLRVPYMGFAGDYRSIVVLNPAASSFGNPILRPDTNFGPNGPVTISKASGVPAYVFVHMDHPVTKLTMHVFEVKTGRTWQLLVDDTFDGRNSTAGGFYLISWLPFDYAGKPAPNGDYVISVEVLKALGDKTDPASSEVWYSPNVTVID